MGYFGIPLRKYMRSLSHIALLSFVIFALFVGRAQAQPISPCNTAVSPSGQVPFSWTASSSLSWELQVDTLSTLFFGTGIVVGPVNSPSTSVTGLLPGKTYFWHVRGNSGANGNGNWGGYGSTCSFTTSTASPPSAPTQSSPANGTAGYVPALVNFQWVASGGATGYDLQVATNTGFSPTVVNLTGIAWNSNGQNVTTLSAGQTYYWRLRASNGGGPSAWTSTWTCYTQSPATTLNLKVFLQGPLVSSTLLMNDALRVAALIPAQEPYTGLGFAGIWNTGATISAGVLTATGNNAIVDWVYVEARHGITNIPLYKYSMLVQRDGDVVMPNGTVPSLLFPMSSVKVSVRHRNHLGACTANNITANGSPVTVDLTVTGTALFGTNAEAPVNGRLALWAGDVTRDGTVKYTGSANDRDPILTAVGSTTPTNTVNGYLLTDVTLDGVTKYTGTGNDRDPVLLTVGSTTPNNTRAQQLP